MAVKKPGSLAYWQDKHFHIIGELGEKASGWYDVRKSIAIIANEGISQWGTQSQVYKTAIAKEIPAWLPRFMMRGAFKDENN